MIKFEDLKACLKQKIATSELQLKDASEKIAQSSSNITILQNRKKVLEDMQKDFEGYNYTVKRLMQDSKVQHELKELEADKEAELEEMDATMKIQAQNEPKLTDKGK